jgi:hypothetical protein
MSLLLSLFILLETAAAESAADPLQFVANLDAAKSADEPL